MVLRNFYILLLVLYALFCLPCFCVSDTCWLKRKLGIQHKGVSKEVLKHIEKQTWSYEKETDFSEFALLQSLKASVNSPVETE